MEIGDWVRCNKDLIEDEKYFKGKKQIENMVEDYNSDETPQNVFSLVGVYDFFYLSEDLELDKEINK